jgi:hypothetical protein
LPSSRLDHAKLAGVLKSLSSATVRRPCCRRTGSGPRRRWCPALAACNATAVPRLRRRDGGVRLTVRAAAGSKLGKRQRDQQSDEVEPRDQELHSSVNGAHGRPPGFTPLGRCIIAWLEG